MNSIFEKINLSGKKKLTILSLIGILSIGLLAGNIFGHVTINRMTDMDGFLSLGERFAAYGNLNGSIRRAPIYPIFLGLIFKIFGENPSTSIFFQAILLALLGISTFLISFKHFQSTRLAFLTGLITVLHPICLWYVSRYWLELLFADLILIMLWSAYKAISDPTPWSLSKFGIFTAIASLCKAITLLFPLFLAAAVLGLYMVGVKPFNYLNKKLLLKIFVIPTIVMLLIISPWTVRNYMVSGTWTLVSSNVGVEFFRGNVYAEYNPFTSQKSIGEIWDIAKQKENQLLAQRGVVGKLSIKQLDAIFNPLMIDSIVHHPGGFLVKIIKQIPAFWIRGENSLNTLAYNTFAFFTLFFFIKGFFVLRKTSILTYIILILVIYFNLIYAATLAWARYSMPIYPPMLILGVYGFAQFRIIKNKGIFLPDPV